LEGVVQGAAANRCHNFWGELASNNPEEYITLMFLGFGTGACAGALLTLVLVGLGLFRPDERGVEED
jgi:hypothetical protein